MTAAALALLLLLAAPQPGVFQTGRYTIAYEAGAEGLARSIAPRLEPEMLRICAALRVQPPAAVTVKVAARADAFMWRQGDSEPWVSGMASPEQNTIFLRPLTGHEVRHNSVAAVASHELAHLAINAKVKGNPVPTWLNEGLAVFLADEPFYARAERLVTIALTGRAFMFRDLQTHFPSTSSDAATAYAQSGDFVRWLYREHGEPAFLRYLDILAEGVDPDKALQAVFGYPLYDLQMKWMASLDRVYGWIPTLTGGTFLWFALALLAIFAWWKKARSMRRVRKDMAAEEEATERLRQLEREKKRLMFAPGARRRRRADPAAGAEDDWETDEDGLEDDGTFVEDDEDWEDEEDDDDGDDESGPPRRRH